jgi:hypothetical protein
LFQAQPSHSTELRQNNGNTYTLISSVTVGSGGAANMGFTSIPATYTDLLVKLSARELDRALTVDGVLIIF